MPFKIRDLMISDLSEPPHPIPFRTCNPITRAICFNTNLGIDDMGDPGDPLASLATLKEQLKRQLAEVERQQAVLEKGLIPQSVEEVDALTNKLTNALEELKALRAKLATD
jgi:hypothetical protein